jgi:hypothetical protein
VLDARDQLLKVGLPAGHANGTGQWLDNQMATEHPNGTGQCHLEPMNWTSLSKGIGMEGKAWLAVAWEIEMFPGEGERNFSQMYKLIQENILSIEHQGNCSKRMFSLSSDHAHMKESYIIEREFDRDGMWEISSPIDLTNEEAELSCRQMKALQKYFVKEVDNKERKKAGFHAHVDGRCLLADERRLVALILVWDNLFDALQRLAKSVLHFTHRTAAETY